MNDFIVYMAILLIGILNLGLVIYFGMKTVTIIKEPEVRTKLATKSGKKIKPKVPYMEHDYKVGQ